MKKIVSILFAIGIVLSASTSVFAGGDVFTIMLREWFPGIEHGDVTVGALASGNIFDDSNGRNVGWANISWSHNGEGIEECGGKTTLIRIKIVMNFYDNSRLVLVGPYNNDEPITANWEFDEESCINGDCPLIGYSDFLDPDITLNEGILECDDKNYIENDIDAAYIAEIPTFQVVRQWFGSYGTRFRWGDVSGILDHTPIVSPAVVGKVTLHR